MNCQPSPEQTCGEVTSDACISISGTWPSCFVTTAGPCYRQSDFNAAVGNLLCSVATNLYGTGFTLPVALPTGVTSVLGSITLTSLTGCTIGSGPNAITLTPTKTTVVSELQNLYNIICANLPISMLTPLLLAPSPNGLSLGCLQAPCGVPIGTLGGLLQALVNAVCDSPLLVYKVTLTQTGVAAPIPQVLEDTIDPGAALSWSYSAVGIYNLTAGVGTPFATASKVELVVGSVAFGNQVTAQVTANNQITVKTGTNAGVLTDALLSNTSLTIKIYP